MNKKEKYLLVIIGVILVCTVGITVIKERQPAEKIQIVRPEQGSEAKSFLFRLDGQEKRYEISIYAREKTQEEIEEAFFQVIQYIDQIICGENNSLSCVTKNLMLPESMAEYDAVIRWNSKQEEIIENSGVVCRDRITEATDVELTAKITIGNEKRERGYVVTVLPYEKGSTEEKLAAVREYLVEKEQTSRLEDTVTFPVWIDSVEILEEEESGNSKWLFLLFPITIFCVIVGKKKEAEKEKKEYERELLTAYPNLVTKLTMYIGAGMTIRTAWEQLAKEYEKNRQSHLGKIICQTVAELHMGKGEEAVYEKLENKLVYVHTND